MQYDPAQFRGAAPHYLRGRAPYSAQLADVLYQELDLDGHGWLLDIGCGPGTLGVQLAHLFDQVTFIDPDPEMLHEARIHASRAGLKNTDFVCSTAENLTSLDLPPARVAAFGQSFHRTDRLRAADAAFELLEPGGFMLLVTHDHTRPAPEQPEHTAAIPHDAIIGLIRRFLGGELRSGDRLASSYDTERFETTLARTRFTDIRAVYAPGRPDIVRSANGVIDKYLSMSYAAPHLFGPHLPKFISALRDLLQVQAANTDDQFWEWPGDTEILIARRA